MPRATATNLRLGSTPISRAYLGSQLVLSALDPFRLAPAEDTPTITATALGASANPGISGSAGWLREKRVGVAEGSAGAAQTSTADLDLTGSTRYRYIGIPTTPGHAANAGNYIRTVYKPGSTDSVQAARWPFTVEFETSAPQVQIRTRAPVNNPTLGVIYVNGLRVTEGVATSSGLSAGNGFGIMLTFPDARPRNIRIVGLTHLEGAFGGVAVTAGHAVTKPTRTVTRRVAFITDSYGNGAGSRASSGAAAVETFVWRLAALMGADEVIAAGIGGTGWVTQLATGTDSLFQARVAPVMAMQPHAVVFAGGRNDQGQSSAAVQSAVGQSLDSVGAIERYVLRTSADGQGVNADIAAACAARGVPFLDVPIDPLPKIADGIHLTYDGHQQLATAAYAQMN